MKKRVRVDSIDERSAFRGWARLDPELMDILNISTGDIIRIEGKKATSAIAIPAKQLYHGKRKILLDGITRVNCGANIGEFVTIEAIQVKPARKVTLVPAHENIQIQGSGESIKNNLINRPVSKGDIISYIVKQTNKGAFSSISPNVFNALFRAAQSRPFVHSLGELRFLVQITEPPNEIVQILDQTKIITSAESREFSDKHKFIIHGKMKRALIEILSEKFLKEITYKRIAYKLNIDENLAQDLVEQLLKSGEIKGKMMADKIILENNGF